MASDANDSDRGTGTAETPASTSSLFVVDDEGMDDRIDDDDADEDDGTSRQPLCAPPPIRSDAYYRDLYKDRLDFRALARDDPDLDAVLHHGLLDFRDPAAVLQLTKTLLRRDFGLALDLPPDRLCPPVPNRLSYVVWLKALLGSTAYDSSTDGVVGLDIGTGASCIYPLLACAQRPRWHFLATDVDATSLQYARANVTRNGLAERIRVVTRSPDDPLVLVSEDDDDNLPARLAFTMVNPPFYASADEMAASAAAKEQPPHSACTGAPVEMVYPSKGGDDTGGGEIAFVGRILAESAVLRDRVGWYTAMVGKLASLVALVGQLRARGIDNYAVAALVYGSKTRRWALGWSYGARRPTVAVARGGGGEDHHGHHHGFESYRHLLPPITEVDVFSLPRVAPTRQSGRETTSSSSSTAASTTSSTLSSTIESLMRSLALASWVWDGQTLRGVGRARENVWGRAWRRKKLREERGGMAGGAETGDSSAAATITPGLGEDCAFGFEVTVRVGVAGTTVGCRWLEGHSEVLYESFCGFLKAKLKESIAASTPGG